MHLMYHCMHLDDHHEQSVGFSYKTMANTQIICY